MQMASASHVLWNIGPAVAGVAYRARGCLCLEVLLYSDEESGAGPV